ncbi:MAG: hypothetical protein ACRCV9_12445 [Burkholderiaceae bacterium]
MPMSFANLKLRLTQHWFFVAATLVISVNSAIAFTDAWEAPRLLEAGMLFDLAVVIPALYWWCYRKTGKTIWPRVIALMCLGIWAAGHLVPDQHHHLLSDLSVLRYAGLAVLVLLELKLVFAMYRAAFGSGEHAQRELDEAFDAATLPPWAQRIVKWEVGVWKKIGAAFKRMFRR